MQGDVDSDEIKGIIPRIVDTTFEKISLASESIEFTVRAGMMEIYNEKIRDLLDPEKEYLQIHEDKQKGIILEGLTERSIGNDYEAFSIMKEGNSNRATAETNMNAQSSRSHSIFLMTLTMNEPEIFSCKTGKLYLVDLAGSEMISKTGATGQTLEEAKKINQSLTMLGRVINALTDGKSTHVPYRDSKLTRILQDSLGGNSKTCLIITASPSMCHSQETLSSCRFGMRAKSIKNNAKVNKQVTVEELKLVIAKLEKELEMKSGHIEQLQKRNLESDFVKVDNQKNEGKDMIISTAIFRAPSQKTASIDHLVKINDLEKLKNEQNKDLDSLMDRLKEERRKGKDRSAKLMAMKQEQNKLKAEIERLQKENKSLIQTTFEQNQKIGKLEAELREIAVFLII